MSFAESAARLAGMTGAMLGWSPDRFWRATPAELAAVLHALAPPAHGRADRATLDRLVAQENSNG